MKSILLIGLGKFGYLVGSELLKMGNEVMVVDKDEERINMNASKFTHAVSANCASEEVLSSFNLKTFDACIVAIGDDFQSSLEITSLLKDLGAKYVISRATTDIQKKFLLRSGADEVLYPDKDIAEKIAVKLNSKNVYDYFELSEDHSIFEIVIPDGWMDKTLLEINPRKNYGINLLMIKRGDEVISSLDAEFTFKANDHMVVFAETSVIMKFTNKKIK